MTYPPSTELSTWLVDTLELISSNYTTIELSWDTRHRNPTLVLDNLEVTKHVRKAGIGTAAMSTLVAACDTANVTLVLWLREKNPVTGTTSSNRLRRFYRRFGFVSNRGKYKDFKYSADMHRKPRNEAAN